MYDEKIFFFETLNSSVYKQIQSWKFFVDDSKLIAFDCDRD